MTAMLKILRIEIDGHFHGSPEVPKPWVAEITGVDARYGLARKFVDRLNDWRGAKRAWSGNAYGVVAAFPLREGRLYEVSRLRGSSSKRHVAREFIRVLDGKIEKVEVAKALAIAERYDGPAVEHWAPDGTAIALVRGLGAPQPLGFVLRDDRRLFRLRPGELHEIVTDEDRQLALVRNERLRTISQADALRWLTDRAVAA